MKTIRTYILYFGVLLLSVSISHAQSILGQWKTIDDETGQAKSIVEIYESNGKVYGKVAKILRAEEQDKICEKCKGKDHNQPIEGLVILKGMSKDKDDEFSGGTIFDPEKGKEYKCKMWIDTDKPNTLNVRGYIAFFFRTQNWQRVTN